LEQVNIATLIDVLLGSRCKHDDMLTSGSCMLQSASILLALRVAVIFFLMRDSRMVFSTSDV
jgi:hypothetical protein